MLGEWLAAWLRRRVDPVLIFDHRILHELAAVGIGYDEKAFRLWLATGEMVTITTYSPADLMRHPLIRFENLTDTIDTRWIPGYEISYWLHELVWPLERPPGDIRRRETPNSIFLRNTASIDERGPLPYRDNPPGGWL